VHGVVFDIFGGSRLPEQARSVDSPNDVRLSRSDSSSVSTPYVWREKILCIRIADCASRLPITHRTNSGTAQLIRELARESVVRRQDRMIRANLVCVRKKKGKHMIQNTRGVRRPFFGPVAALNLCHG
jgi:hypothetical protein